jgi:hypothetical protein
VDFRTGARSNYHALSTAFTKRIERRRPPSGTYLLLPDCGMPTPMPYTGLHIRLSFALAPDFSVANIRWRQTTQRAQSRPERHWQLI